MIQTVSNARHRGSFIHRIRLAERTAGSPLSRTFVHMERAPSSPNGILRPQGPEASFSLATLNRAAAAGDPEAIQLAKERLAQEFPDQLEAVQAITDLPRYLQVKEQLDRHMEKGKERQQLIREQAEYHFLLTHLVASITDRKVLMRLWDALERVAQAQKNVRGYLLGRAGVLGQVATYKIFQRLGLHPALSHPAEDRHNAIDLWEERDPVQVKGGGDQPSWVEVNRMGPTNIVVCGADGEQRISSKLMQEIERFTRGLAEYEASTGQRVTGHLLVLPKASYDKTTGEPTEDIVEFVRGHLRAQSEKAA